MRQIPARLSSVTCCGRCVADYAPGKAANITLLLRGWTSFSGFLLCTKCTHKGFTNSRFGTTRPLEGDRYGHTQLARTLTCVQCRRH